MTAASSHDTRSRQSPLPTTVLTEIDLTIKASERAGFHAERDTMLHRIGEIAYAAGLTEGDAAAKRSAIGAPGWTAYAGYMDACKALGRDGVKVNDVAFGYYMMRDGSVVAGHFPLNPAQPTETKPRLGASEEANKLLNRAVDLSERAEVDAPGYRERVLAAIPTSWLDSLLTGEKAVLKSGYSYDGKDIERLLMELRKRIEAIPLDGPHG